MKLFYKLLGLILLPLAMGCNSTPENADQLFSITINNTKKAYTNGDVLQLSVNSKKGKPIDAVTYSLDEGSFASNNSITLSNEKMGTHLIHAKITSEGTDFEVEQSFKVVASKAPELYGYRVLETYPHDMNAYTQGLEFHGDTLYESTGMYKTSSLRKTNYQTGKVLKIVDLADTYFGEGLTIFNDKVIQLTWRENTGFIYDLNTLERTGTFVYNQSKEGWGLCNNGTAIFKSDGTEKIWTLNPETLAEEDHIEIYTNKSVIDNVNELEWVEGKIYANIYQKDAVAIVNPENGAVEGVINLKGLQEKVTQHTKLDVLNGIAYKGEPNILYITGKNWDALFKIEIFKMN